MNRPATIDGMPVMTSTKKRDRPGELARRRTRPGRSRSSMPIGTAMTVGDADLLEGADDGVVDAAARLARSTPFIEWVRKSTSRTVDALADRVPDERDQRDRGEHERDADQRGGEPVLGLPAALDRAAMHAGRRRRRAARRSGPLDRLCRRTARLMPTAAARRATATGAQRGQPRTRAAAARQACARPVPVRVAWLMRSAPENSLRRAMISRAAHVDQQGDDEQDQTGGDQRVAADLAGLAELAGDVRGEGAAAGSSRWPVDAGSRREHDGDGHRLAERAAEAEHRGGDDAGAAEGQHRHADDLPAGGAERQAASSCISRHLQEDLAARRGDDRQDHDRQHDAGGEQRAGGAGRRPCRRCTVQPK